MHRLVRDEAWMVRQISPKVHLEVPTIITRPGEPVSVSDLRQGV